MILPIFAFSDSCLQNNRIFFLFFQNIKITALSIYYFRLHASCSHAPLPSFPPAPSHCLFLAKKEETDCRGWKPGFKIRVHIPGLSPTELEILWTTQMDKPKRVLLRIHFSREGCARDADTEVISYIGVSRILDSSWGHSRNYADKDLTLGSSFKG